MIVIVDYNMGNLGSISNMIKKIGKKHVVTNDLEIIEQADKIILPGVGRFDTAMHNLEILNLIPVLNKKAIIDKVSVLGICLGMQLLTKYSEEGNVAGLGWIDARTKRFDIKDDMNLKVPHMGWNDALINKEHLIASGFTDQPRFYFVHSYHVVCSNQDNVLFSTTHGCEFASGIINENIIGVQFHPEKSHKFGLQLFRNFIEKC